jgi:hypothetical protein
MREQENTLQAGLGKAGAALSNRKPIPLQRAATLDLARYLCKWHRGAFAPPQQGAIELLSPLKAKEYLSSGRKFSDVEFLRPWFSTGTRHSD